MIFPKNRLLEDNSHEISIFFRKFGNMSSNLFSDAVVIGALMGNNCVNQVVVPLERLEITSLSEEQLAIQQNQTFSDNLLFHMHIGHCNTCVYIYTEGKKV